MSDGQALGLESSPETSDADWRARLRQIVDTMREMSRQTDPQEMVRLYGRRMRQLNPVDGFVALSRRDLEVPRVRVTRFSGWQVEMNPWKQRDLLPVIEGGLFSELIYSDEPRIIDDLRVDPSDPAAPYLAGFRSLAAVPNYDGGVALNMTVTLRAEPNAFDPETFPEYVWMSNLFGRATQNLVLAEKVREAYEAVDRELKVVADIQRSLLPARLPDVPHLDLAASYRTSRHAGGDYYDLIPLPGDRWGLLIADVSGHGTPAAVMMAITHSLAHSFAGPPVPPGRMLDYVNDRLAASYTADSEAFVTAFYGVYDPATRRLHYASAGHNPPRLRRGDGEAVAIDGARSLPLGVMPGLVYPEDALDLAPGDQVIFYTDGITEAVGEGNAMYGTDRLDAILARCGCDADSIVRAVLDDLDRFTGGRPPVDDQTLLVARVVA